MFVLMILLPLQSPEQTGYLNIGVDQFTDWISMSYNIITLLSFYIFEHRSGVVQI